jgi:spermidine/putrescine transport system permease protein
VRSRRGDVALGALFVATLAFLYLPIAVLVGLSFNASGLPTAWGGFSTKWYGELVRDVEIRDAAVATLVVAVFATALSVLVGTPLAFGLARLRSRLLDGAVFVPMIIPDIVLAIALLSAFNLVAIVVATRLSHFEHSTVEASLDLGASHLQTFFYVTLPQIAPGVIAGALIVFTLSVDEFVIAYFTAGIEVTLPIKIYSMIRFGVTPVVNALATVVLAVSILLVLGSLRLRGRESVA